MYNLSINPYDIDSITSTVLATVSLLEQKCDLHIVVGNAVFENFLLFQLPFQREFLERQFIALLLAIPQSTVACPAEKVADKLEHLSL